MYFETMIGAIIVQLVLSRCRVLLIPFLRKFLLNSRIPLFHFKLRNKLASTELLFKFYVVHNCEKIKARFSKSVSSASRDFTLIIIPRI